MSEKEKGTGLEEQAPVDVTPAGVCEHRLGQPTQSEKFSPSAVCDHSGLTETIDVLTGERDSLQRKYDACRGILEQYAKDLAFWAACHAADYPVRRNKELADEIARVGKL